MSVLDGCGFGISVIRLYGWREIMRPETGNFMKGTSHTKSLTLKEESGGFLGKGC
jgi:hypothetical protein